MVVKKTDPVSVPHPDKVDTAAQLTSDTAVKDIDIEILEIKSKQKGRILHKKETEFLLLQGD